MVWFSHHSRHIPNHQISPFLFRPALRATFPPGEGSGFAAEMAFVYLRSATSMGVSLGLLKVRWKRMHLTRKA